MLSRALRCRCPACGEGAIYTGLLTVGDACPRCGLDLRKHDSGDGPAFFVMLGVGLLALAIAVAFEIAAKPPLWLHLAVAAPVILGGTVLGLRVVKSVLISLAYRHNLLKQ